MSDEYDYSQHTDAGSLRKPKVDPDEAMRQFLAAEDAEEAAKAKPKAPAGWYPHSSMADTVRYWDGQAWTEHIAPVGTSQQTTGTTPASAEVRRCPYCTSAMPRQAQRCATCGGDLRFCPRCKDLVGLTSKQKFVGVLRGGMKTQYGCMRCYKVLDGPRF